MKLFKNLRKRRQKKLEELSKRYEGDVLLPKKSGDVDSVKKYIVEGCEQLTKDVQDLTNDRKEYRSITNYLTDIQVIENLGDEDKTKIGDYANNIMFLNDSKSSSLEVTKKMPDSQYQDMEKYKDEIPSAINRLKDHENNQDILKKDLDYLEGEKLEWTYEKHQLTKELRVLKRISVFLIVLLGILITFFLVAKYVLEKDAGIFGIIIVGCVAFSEMFMLLRIIDDKSMIKQSIVNYNGAVALQNRIKLRYVNITNAVEYIREKYHVTNARDFEKQWQTYLDITMEKERLERTNDDLEYYREMLVKTLRKYQLYDASIWQYQAEALVKPKEMVEVKHALLERRTKIRKRIEFQTENIESKKHEIHNVAVDNQLMTEDVKNILSSIERFLNPNDKNA